MKNPKRNELADKYLEGTVAYQTNYGHNSRLTNQATKAIAKAAKKIRLLEDRGIAILSPMLKHELPHVRLWAAYHLLPVYEFSAIKTLKNLISNEDSFVYVEAEILLKEWQNSTLDVDWFMNSAD